MSVVGAVVGRIVSIARRPVGDPIPTNTRSRSPVVFAITGVTTVVVVVLSTIAINAPADAVLEVSDSTGAGSAAGRYDVLPGGARSLYLDAIRPYAGGIVSDDELIAEGVHFCEEMDAGSDPLDVLMSREDDEPEPDWGRASAALVASTRYICPAHGQTVSDLLAGEPDVPTDSGSSPAEAYLNALQTIVTIEPGSESAWLQLGNGFCSRLDEGEAPGSIIIDIVTRPETAEVEAVALSVAVITMCPQHQAALEEAAR